YLWYTCVSSPRTPARSGDEEDTRPRRQAARRPADRPSGGGLQARPAVLRRARLFADVSGHRGDGGEGQRRRADVPRRGAGQEGAGRSAEGRPRSRAGGAATARRDQGTGGGTRDASEGRGDQDEAAAHRQADQAGRVAHSAAGGNVQADSRI